MYPGAGENRQNRISIQMDEKSSEVEVPFDG